MALQVMYRGCCRLSASLALNRLAAAERLYQLRSHRPRCPSFAGRISVTLFRPYSSDKPPETEMRSVRENWLSSLLQSKLSCFLISKYFDKDFSIDQFTREANQTFMFVSRRLAHCQIEALEDLVMPELLDDLEDKCNSWPTEYKDGFLAEALVHSKIANMMLYNLKDGRSFIVILMYFWYVTSNDELDNWMWGHVFSKAEIGGKSKKVLTANYQFQREFTKGVRSDWTITRMEHFTKLI